VEEEEEEEEMHPEATFELANSKPTKQKNSERKL